jgi:hypothetical protein
MKMRLMSVTVGFVSVLALAACKSSSSSSSGGAGGSIGGAGGTGGSIGGAGGSAGGAGGSAGGAGGSAPDCTCACTTLMSAGGCADLCDDAQNNNPNQPNYCNGSPALTMCATCLMNSCNFTAAQIADDTACP